MFKYVLVIMIILAGCTQNKNELSEPKSSIDTKYGELKINSSKIFFKGKEIDFEGWDPFEIVQYWKLKEKILVLVSHANTNRCERRYRIVTLDNIGAHSSKSFGNCDAPSGLSIDGNALKIKFERTNASAEVYVEYDNYNLIISEGSRSNLTSPTKQTLDVAKGNKGEAALKYISEHNWVQSNFPQCNTKNVSLYKYELITGENIFVNGVLRADGAGAIDGNRKADFNFSFEHDLEKKFSYHHKAYVGNNKNLLNFGIQPSDLLVKIHDTVELISKNSYRRTRIMQSMDLAAMGKGRVIYETSTDVDYFERCD